MKNWKHNKKSYLNKRRFFIKSVSSIKEKLGLKTFIQFEEPSSTCRSSCLVSSFSGTRPPSAPTSCLPSSQSSSCTSRSAYSSRRPTSAPTPRRRSAKMTKKSGTWTWHQIWKSLSWFKNYNDVVQVLASVVPWFRLLYQYKLVTGVVDAVVKS